MLLLLAAVAAAAPARVLDAAEGQWVGCVVEVNGRDVGLVDVDGHFELDPAALPAKVRLRCVDRRTPKLTVVEVPAEVDLRARPAVARRWVFPNEHVDLVTTRVREALPVLAERTGALAEAGTAAISDPAAEPRVRAAAAALRDTVTALREATRLSDEALQGDAAATARYVRLTAFVERMDTITGRAVAHADRLPAPDALATLAGEVTLVTAELQLISEAVLP